MMNHWKCQLLLYLVGGMFALSLAAPADRPIVCLGDSITDGYTYGQLIMQALAAAERPVPPVICAGAGGDTAPQMAARLDEAVLRFKPRMVTVSAGTNDALRGVEADDYAAALRSIITRCRAADADVVLLTPCMILSRKGKTVAAKEASGQRIQQRLDAYEGIIRTLADEYGLTLVENRAGMQAAVEAGKTIMVSDGIHPNYFGQSLIARSILDAIGFEDVPLPKTFEPPLFPGVIREWHMLASASAKPLTAETIADLRVTPAWKVVEVPRPAADEAPTPEDWGEQIRRNGFADQLHRRVGKGRIVSMATVMRETTDDVWVSLGGAPAAVWVNGRRIHEQKVWRGFHAGHDRLPIKLQAGVNKIVVETTGDRFFLSITDKQIWEADLYGMIRIPEDETLPAESGKRQSRPRVDK